MSSSGPDPSATALHHDADDLLVDGRALGPGRVAVEDGMIVVTPSAHGDVVRWRVAALATIDRDVRTVRLEDQWSARLEIRGESADAIERQVRQAARDIPELTRALRWMGSSRRDPLGDGAASDEPRYFGPLLEARKRGAAARTAAAAVEAFNAARIGEQMTAFVADAVAARHPDHAPRRRAQEAHLLEILEPVLAALDRLGERAAAALEDVDDLRRWRDWAGAVAAAYEAADRAWPALRRTLAGRS